MSDEQPIISENAKKYKTLGRALLANDVSACHEILKIYQDSGKSLSEDEIFRLGVSWFGNKNGRPIETAAFLREIGFNFEQVTSTKDENVGTKLPFRLLDTPEDQTLLLELISRKWVDVDLIDGAGDGFVVNALIADQFDFAGQLVQAGADINAENIACQTPLHVCAGRLRCQAVEWLCRNGADPTREDLQNAIAAQMVPETLEDWDTDAMFDVLSNYKDDFEAGRSFESTPEFTALVAREKSLTSDNEDDDQTIGEQAEQAKALLGKLGM